MRDALDTAIQRLSVEMTESERPDIDHDTKGVPGSPEIAATILKKIENASVFVADITPIAVSKSGKHIPNPNVLIELGFAKMAVGTENIILVWNTAITGCSVEDLPFDLRHRRGPLSIDLPYDAPTAELRSTRASLTDQFEGALRACLNETTAKTGAEPKWRRTKSNDPSIWEGGDKPLNVNRRFDPPISIGFESAPRAYARIVPERWDRVEDTSSKLNGDYHPTPLGRFGGLDWGRTTGGFIAYRASESIYERGSTPTATRWFQDSGELWGVASSFFSEHENLMFYSEAYAVLQWISWLRRSILVCRSLGGAGRIHCKLGVFGIEGTRWPKNAWITGPPNVAVEDLIESKFIFSSSDNDEIIPAVRAMNNSIRDSFGLDSLDADDFAREFEKG